MFHKMFRNSLFALIVMALALFAVAPVFAAGPSFIPHIYADGVAWGTKGLNELPAPNPQMIQSFDVLVKFANGGNSAQLPVSDAGPGNPAYNGGRWYVHTATWDAGYLASVNNNPPLLTSYAQVLEQVQMGHLSLVPGAVSGPTFFLCPLLPVK